MSLPKVELPSNRKFGLFFTAVFLIAAAYSYRINSHAWLYVLGGLGVAFLIITLVNSEVLLPLNKLWMKFGLILGMIVSPVMMGVIFFVIFTPIAISMRLCGRDVLRLRLKKKSSHWVSRETEAQSGTFKNQF